MSPQWIHFFRTIIRLVIGIALFCILRPFLVILLILLVIFPALRSRAGIWSKAYGRPQQQTPQEDNRDVVDVDATVVEDDALPAADQQKDGQ